MGVNWEARDKFRYEVIDAFTHEFAVRYSSLKNNVSSVVPRLYDDGIHFIVYVNYLDSDESHSMSIDIRDPHGFDRIWGFLDDLLS